MTAVREDDGRMRDDAGQDCTLVWIDTREAVIVRWQAGSATVERHHSDVPPHHRSTGHVRYDPAVQHGGGAPHDTGEQRRLEHLARFVESIAGLLPATDELLIMGPGTVRDRLEQRVRELDRHGSRSRSVTCRATGRLTDRQLLARVRHLAGSDPSRLTSGPHGRPEPPARRPSGAVRPTPRRAGAKPTIVIDPEELIEEGFG
jgi:hypothetical protein